MNLDITDMTESHTVIMKITNHENVPCPINTDLKL